MMRVLLLLLALSSHVLADMALGRNRFSPGSDYTVDFDFARGEDFGWETTFTIKNRAREVIYTDTLAAYVEGARWTADGKFIVAAVPANTNGHAKNPWRYYFYLISVTGHEWRWLSGSDESPFISAEVWCKQPDTIILVANAYDNRDSDPDAPVLRRYKMSELWKTLE